MNKTNKMISVLVILLLLIVGVKFLTKNNKQPENKNQADQNYNPTINPADFTTKITNPYFSLAVGKMMVYEAQANEVSEKVEINIEKETKTILGVTTLLYHDKVWLNGQLHEDTKDWLAQDKEGNVWYFGENVDNFENGKLVDHDGSWIAGVDNAKPGIWIKAKQIVGDSYRQEYYLDQAEDMRDVIAVEQTVKTKLATYTGCVKMLDWTSLDTNSKEHKYYCPEVGAEVLIENLSTGVRQELTKIVSP